MPDHATSALLSQLASLAPVLKHLLEVSLPLLALLLIMYLLRGRLASAFHSRPLGDIFCFAVLGFMFVAFTNHFQVQFRYMVPMLAFVGTPILWLVFYRR